MVVDSNGAYNHDEVFHLEVSFAYMLMLSRYEKAMYLDRADQVKQNLKQ